MHLTKIFKLIINFLMSLPKNTKKEIRIYKEQLLLAKGDKLKINLAENSLIYFFLKNWLIKTVIPLVLITLAIWLITKYYILIFAIMFGCYLLWSYFSKKQQSNEILEQQLIAAIYQEVSQFIFNPLREMYTWLDIKQPQGVTDIYIPPFYSKQDGADKLLFKLLKKVPEPVESEKLLFSKKMLQSLIVSRLQEKQLIENRTSYFNDLPCLIVDTITDFGEYIQIQIVYVNNVSNYNYVIKKTLVQKADQIPKQADDEDF